MFHRRHESSVLSRCFGKPVRVFKPQLLQLYKTDGQVQTYRYGKATISAAHDGERIYVCVDRPLARETTDGLLAWLGMDMRRNVARYRCDDNSRYFVQASA